jgi:hypothetical protein
LPVPAEDEQFCPQADIWRWTEYRRYTGYLHRSSLRLNLRRADADPRNLLRTPDGRNAHLQDSGKRWVSHERKKMIDSLFFKDANRAEPELYHYTTWAGLKGILTSQCLWATHYRALNDTSEVIHLKENLLRATISQMKSDLISLGKKSLHNKLKISKKGGAATIAKYAVTDTVNGLYRYLLDESTSHVGVFICSLCSHAQDEEYERQNGLLSQWRSYGEASGAYTIVFDTAQLIELIDGEYPKFADIFIGLKPVEYNTGFEDFCTRYENLIKLTNVLAGYRVKHNMASAEEMMQEISILFCLSALQYKHQAFFEEREVRLFTLPATIDWAKRNNKHVNKIRKIHLRGSGGDIPYIKLFEHSNELPIKRIIVGPHRDRKQLVNTVKALVGNKINVVASNTPYVTKAL